MTDVVINEIMYHPSNLQNEFIELRNVSSQDIDISHWSFSDGIKYTFPENTILPADGYLILSSNPDAMKQHYLLDTAYGPYEGKLSNDGERIQLIDSQGTIIDQLQYSDEEGWPPNADGLGHSLERIHPEMASSHPVTWDLGPIGGTPSKVNENSSPHALPIISNVYQTPTVPSSKDHVRFYCRILHPQVIERVNLFYKEEQQSTFSSIQLFDDGEHGDFSAQDHIYSGKIPPHALASVIEFYIQALDIAGQKGYFPLRGRGRPALYRVMNVNHNNDLPLYYILMRDADEELLRTRNVWSNEQLDATFVFQNQIFYNVGVRFRGKGSRGREPKSYRVDFSQTRYFGSIRKLNLNAVEPYRQYIGLECFRVLDMPAPEKQFVSLVFNESYVPHYIQVERTGKNMMERVFGDESGNLYRGLEQANLDYRGENPNSYYSNYDKITNELENDYSDIITLCAAFSNTTDSEFVEELKQVINIQQWIRWFAIKKILNDLEGGLSKERGDDYYIYHNPQDDLFYLLPWDLDSVIVRPFRDLHQYDTPSVFRLVTHSELAPLYYQELYNILMNELPQARMDAIIDQTAPVANQNLRQELKQISREIRNFILSSIPLDLSVNTTSETCSTLLADSDDIRYFRGKTAPPNNWNDNDFDDTAWETGPGGIGYGDGDERTILNDMRYNYTTVFVRNSFEVNDPTELQRLLFHINYDDAFVIYINGLEVARSNFSGQPNHLSVADNNHEAGQPEQFIVDNPESFLTPGKNTLAAVGINVSLSSSDLSLLIQLDAYKKNPDIVQLYGSTNAMNTHQVLVNQQTASFTPWKAQWSFVSTLAKGRNLFHITAVDKNDMILDATHIAIYKDTVPPTEGRETYGHEIWSADQSPVIVNEKIIIPKTDSLTINAGTEVHMASSAAIIVHGTLTTAGTASSPVSFIPKENNPSSYGILADNAQGVVTIQYTEFSHSSPFIYKNNKYPAVINVKNSTAEITHCYFHDMTPSPPSASAIDALDSHLLIQANRFENMGEMVHCQNSSSIIEKNQFHNILGYNDAIDLDGQMGEDAPLIQDNTIIGSHDDGIDIGYASPIIARNWIQNCFDKGISLEGQSSISVLNNIIIHCEIGIAVKDQCQASIIHNTIVSSTTGISAYEKNANQRGGVAEIINCIVWDSKNSIDWDEKSTINIEHSNLMQLPDIFEPNNFSVLPLFLDTTNNNYQLQESSPMIDMGKDMNINNDYIGTSRPQRSLPDIGAYEFRNESTIRMWRSY